MRMTFYFLFLLSLVSCSSSPKRTLASEPPPPGEFSCLEKTTRKECFSGKDGKMSCACVPDESEMDHFP